MSRPALLFVSGAGLPEWIWDGVRRELGVADTEVAPAPASAGATLRDHARAALASAPADRVVVVAHSLGGAVASGLLALAPERVLAVLGIAAAFPGARRSYADSLPAANGLALRALTAVAGTRPPEGAIRAMAEGAPPAVAERLVADFAPASRRVFVDRLPSWWRAPARAGYVVTTADRELPVRLQERYARAVGSGWTAQLATGHLPMVTDPAGTAERVARFLSGLA